MSVITVFNSCDEESKQYTTILDVFENIHYIFIPIAFRCYARNKEGDILYISNHVLYV